VSECSIQPWKAGDRQVEREAEERASQVQVVRCGEDMGRQCALIAAGGFSRTDQLRAITLQDPCGIGRICRQTGAERRRTGLGVLGGGGLGGLGVAVMIRPRSHSTWSGLSLPANHAMVLQPGGAADRTHRRGKK
jgi:hypothetical protein